ncbi:LysR substrate-binding domain-containing protein [Verticiella alkaliphila]|uniref:LysR substrate-binding domain-containing protein n=1 Tax=Verticiella alkaliphila TaxID=2779529 RepID=UPI00209AF114|nr:LysR substrate-binding domain-containing protein [Verticiella sp. GG226]
MSISLRQLKYFVQVVELGNLTRAAEALHVAQPALSQQMASLEDLLGLTLLVRGPRGVTPTAEGVLLHRHAQTILRQVDSTPGLLRQAADHITGTVSVGLASSTARMLALPLIQQVKAELPAIVVEIVDVPSADLTKFVLQGRVDFALSPDQQPLQGLTHERLIREDLLLLTHPDVRLRRRKPGIADIAGLPMILPSPPNTLRARVDHAFLTAGFATNLYAEASTSAILIPAVAAGLAATLLPYSAAHHEIDAGTIHAHTTAMGLTRELVLCASDAQPLTVAVSRVVDVCKREIRRLVQSGTWQGCALVSAGP